MIREQSTEISFRAPGLAGEEPDPSAGPRGSLFELSPESRIHGHHLGPRHPPLSRTIAQLPTSRPGFHAVLPQPGLLATQPERSFKPPSQTVPRPLAKVGWIVSKNACPPATSERECNKLRMAMPSQWIRVGPKSDAWCPHGEGGDGDSGDGGWSGVSHRSRDAKAGRQHLAAPWFWNSGLED